MVEVLGFSTDQQSITPPRLLISSSIGAGIRSLTLGVDGGAMATQLGFQAVQLAVSRPVLTFFSPIPQGFRVITLDAAADDPVVTQLGFSDGQSAGSDQGILTLGTSGPSPSTVTFLDLGADRGDTAVSELGLDDGRDDATVRLLSRSLTDEFFIQGASVGGAVSVAEATGGELPSGRFGFLGAQATASTASASATVSFQLEDPATETPGGRVEPGGAPVRDRLAVDDGYAHRGQRRHHRRHPQCRDGRRPGRDRRRHSPRYDDHGDRRRRHDDHHQQGRHGLLRDLGIPDRQAGGHDSDEPHLVGHEPDRDLPLDLGHRLRRPVPGFPRLQRLRRRADRD